jgi:hypothetical protein
MRFFHWTIEQFEEMRNPKNGSHFLLERQANSNKYTLVTPIEKYEK